MTIGVIISFIVLGLLLILIEFLVIPGVTIPGIVGTLLIVGGVVLAYYYHPGTLANYTLSGTLLVILFVFILVFKTKTWQKMGLGTTIDGHVEAFEKDAYKVGEPGKTISRLAPIGKILINDKIIEARSMGSYIDSGIEVVVSRIEQNKIFVETKKN